MAVILVQIREFLLASENLKGMALVRTEEYVRAKIPLSEYSPQIERYKLTAQ
jgi:hypothetical protein